MNSSVAFVPISEVAFRARKLPGFERDAFHDQMVRVAIFLINHNGDNQRVDFRVLAQLDGEYAFIDEGSWRINIATRIKDHNSEFVSPDHGVAEAVSGDLNVYAGGFTSVDKEYDENLGMPLQVANYLLVAARSDDADELLSSIGVSEVLVLNELDGMALFIREETADRLLQELESGEAGGEQPIRQFTKQQIEAEWDEFIKQYKFPNKPTQADRNAWGWERGLTRERVRKLQRERSPDYWKKTNNPGT